MPRARRRGASGAQRADHAREQLDRVVHVVEDRRHGGREPEAAAEHRPRTRRAPPPAGGARASGCRGRTPPCNRRDAAALERSWTRRRHDPDRDHALRHAPPPRHSDAVGRQRHLQGTSTNVEFYAFFDTVINAYLIDPGGLDIHAGEVIGLCVESHCRFDRAARVPGGRRRRDARRAPRPVERALRARAVRRGAPRSPPPRAGSCTCSSIAQRGRRPAAIPDGVRAALGALDLSTSASSGTGDCANSPHAGRTRSPGSIHATNCKDDLEVTDRALLQERRVAELRHAVAESITCPPDPDDREHPHLRRGRPRPAPALRGPRGPHLERHARHRLERSRRDRRNRRSGSDSVSSSAPAVERSTPPRTCPSRRRSSARVELRVAVFVEVETLEERERRRRRPRLGDRDRAVELHDR